MHHSDECYAQQREALVFSLNHLFCRMISVNEKKALNQSLCFEWQSRLIEVFNILEFKNVPAPYSAVAMYKLFYRKAKRNTAPAVLPHSMTTLLSKEMLQC